MSKLTLVLAFLVGLSFTLHAGQLPVTVTVPVAEQAEQTTNSQTVSVAPDKADDSSSEDAKKKRRKKKKKQNPVLKWILVGTLAAAALVLYIVTDGEGYHSR